MATTYTPLTPTMARSRLAVATRRRESSISLSQARGELALANVLKTLDQAVAAGASLDAGMAAYLDTYVRTRFGIQAEA